MQLRHFAAFAPVCPVCAQAQRAPPPLVLAHAIRRAEGDIAEGVLHCPLCEHEYPILDGIPVIVPDLARLLAERGVELLVRGDLDPMLEGLFGDAIGPDSWFDAMRQVLSTYGWDGYGDLDPAEGPAGDGPRPGAARRCLARLRALAPDEDIPVRQILDIGCAAGRTSFDLAASAPDALVLGVDTHLALLRLARGAAEGLVSYPRRRIGVVYDRRRFAVSIEPAARVDFWACDATALPFAGPQADLCCALNVIDCVAEPARLLASLAGATRPGGRLLLSTPYDWSTRATPLAAWLGGHSQRAAHGGGGEAFLHALIDGTAAWQVLAEQADWPWQTRLHARSAVHYSTHLVALRRS